MLQGKAMEGNPERHGAGFILDSEVKNREWTRMNANMGDFADHKAP